MPTHMYILYTVQSVVYTSIEGVVWSPDSLCEADLSPDMNNCVCEDSLGVRLVRVTTITTDSSRGYSSHNTSALHHILSTAVHYMATINIGSTCTCVENSVKCTLHHTHNALVTLTITYSASHRVDMSSTVEKRHNSHHISTFTG